MKTYTEFLNEDLKTQIAKTYSKTPLKNIKANDNDNIKQMVKKSNILDMIVRNKDAFQDTRNGVVDGDWITVEYKDDGHINKQDDFATAFDIFVKANITKKDGKFNISQKSQIQFDTDNECVMFYFMQQPVMTWQIYQSVLGKATKRVKIKTLKGNMFANFVNDLSGVGGENENNNTQENE